MGKPVRENKPDYFVHPSAIIDEGVNIGEDAKVWHFCHLRSGAQIGESVTLGKDVYIDEQVVIKAHSRIQNGVSVFNGVEVNRWCFVGPNVVFTNDNSPRAGSKTWNKVPTTLELGSSLGAGAIIRCGVTIGAFAMVGAGAVITKNVPPFHLFLGVPATCVNKVCACGESLFDLDTPNKKLIGQCCKKKLDERLYLEAHEYVNNLD